MYYSIYCTTPNKYILTMATCNSNFHYPIWCSMLVQTMLGREVLSDCVRLGGTFIMFIEADNIRLIWL